MFNGKIENEILDGEPWSLGQQPKLPIHLQLLAEKEQGRQDIWELPPNIKPDNPLNQNTLNKKFTLSVFMQKHFKFSFFRVFRSLFIH